MERSSGILLHITSLPSKYGIGNFGKEAYAFVDFLHAAGQKYWQILPLCPPGYGDSPYQGFSAFAGNPYLIDPEQLIGAGWLSREVLSSVDWSERDDQVDFRKMYDERLRMLHAAFGAFAEAPPADFAEFTKQEAGWLPEYALFMAIKAHFDDRPWLEWPADIRLHQPQALSRYRELLAQDVQFHCFLQYVFHTQWQKLRAYAHERGVKIIGDIPIYVPLDSADVWANPENFQLGRTRRPRCVAGCPPDGFSRNGQYWGNPIYDWEKMERDGFSWWLQRIGAAGRNYDVVRIDHFRGIESYWSIPAVNKTARKGRWVKGPGIKLVDAIKAAYPDIEFIAEDLGYPTPSVQQLLHDSGWPGMKVLEFAFDSRDTSSYLPHTYTPHCICYTGTHDNRTLKQWCAKISLESDAYARNYLGIHPEDDLAQAIIEAGEKSKAKLFVAQMQDYLRLGGEARMNEPGTLKPENWRWRMRPGQANSELAAEILRLTQSAKRV